VNARFYRGGEDPPRDGSQDREVAQRRLEPAGRQRQTALRRQSYDVT
jgi:hypothetical protein